jgi:hypothetical protein
LPLFFFRTVKKYKIIENMNKPKTRNENIVVQEMEKEILIYNLKTNKAFCLNEASALIYQLCDGKNSVAEISQALSKKLNQPMTDDLIWLALDSFKKDNLLEDSKEFEIDFKGLNRRQIIKKVGLTSLAVLPMVSSIIAPSAANAASGPTNLAINAACTSNAQCASGNCFGGTKCCVPGSGGVSPGGNLGGAAGNGSCSTPGAANATCTTVRGSNCCTGTAVATQCNDAGPGPNFGTYSVACQCT